MKQNTLIEFVSGLGVRAVKNRIESARAIGADDPRRDAARELFLHEGEDLALLKLLADERRTDGAALATTAKEKRDADVRETWAKARVGNGAERFTFFNQAAPEKVGGVGVYGAEGGRTSVLADALGGPIGRHAKIAAGVFADADRKPRVAVGFGPASGYMVLCVKVEHADAVAKRLALPATLSWTSGGWTSWLYRGDAATDILGEKTRIVSPSAPTGFGKEKTFAPMGADTKWRTPPKSALPATGDPVLPMAPDGIANAAEHLCHGGDELLDGLLIG